MITMEQSGSKARSELAQEKVIVFSAPSGSGKTTLVKHVLDHFPEVAFSVSCTTRKPRGAEVHGVDYYFLSPEEFRTKIAENAFVEFEEVYSEKYYGTLISEVERIWKSGKAVIFDVDVLGGIALKKHFGAKALSMFIMPPSVAELERRLIARATDDPQTVKIRVEKAAQEMKFSRDFDAVIINTDLAEAKVQADNLITNFLKNQS